MKRKINSYVSTWTKRGYQGGIPDEADANLEALNKVPSYRAIVKAILKNDVALISLGFSKEKSTHYMALKKLEIENRERLSSSKRTNESDI